jgi:hypothetical protein
MHSRSIGLALLAISAALIAIGVAPSLSQPRVVADPRPVAAPVASPGRPGDCCDETKGWCPPEGFLWQDCGKNC